MENFKNNGTKYKSLNKDRNNNIFKSHKRIISKNILAKTDSPRSNLSAMDGIVIFKTELKKNNIFKIIGESKAGTKSCPSIKKVKQFLYTQVHPFQD